MNEQNAISPLGGRYKSLTKELSDFFSEYALMKYRLMIEIEYFIALSFEKGVEQFPEISKQNQKILRSLYLNFSHKNAVDIKQIEKITNHDIKAVEYFLKNKLQQMPLKTYIEFVHFGLTSADINNLAYSLMWKHAVQKVYTPILIQIYKQLKTIAKHYACLPMLAMTHGQPASPTTVGKEFAIYTERLKNQIIILKNQKLKGKLNGATGTWAAHHITYPNVDWITFSKRFISFLDLEPNIFTTQIEPFDSLAQSYHTISRINTILTDLCQDMWLYISRGIFKQKKKQGEIGSSTMPHKINPIYFENAEGNFGISTALLNYLANKLPISRMQRDLSGSTVIRNQGVALGHSFLACKSTLKGLSRIEINKEKLNQELNEHPEVLAEAIQAVLRKAGYDKPYEKLKQLTCGQKITKENLYLFIKNLDIPEEEKEKLLNLTPENYIGLAEEVIRML